MQYILRAPSKIKGKVQLEASKSISNRALIIHALSGNKGKLFHLSQCDDTNVTLRALKERSADINIMAAGTAMRFLTAFFAIQEEEHSITGTERICNRPIGILVNALRELGANIHYLKQEGYPPLLIKGKKLNGGELTLKSNVSSQFISALLMVAPYFETGLKLHLEGEILSRPYINMTIQLMQHYHADVEWLNHQTLYVSPKPYEGIGDFTIESDWSGASYWYETIALSPDENAQVTLPTLFFKSTQGDAKVREYFQTLGVQTTWNEDGILLQKDLKATIPSHINIDLSDNPDLAQTLVVTYCIMGIKFKVSGLQTLTIKETNRIEALQKELLKLGFILQTQNNDTLIWKGEKTSPQLEKGIDTYKDHRMALAFAPTALFFKELRINDPEVVTKSYPNFWEDLKNLSFKIDKL